MRICTEHTRRKPGARCGLCGAEIHVGERYRFRFHYADDFLDGDPTEKAHVYCAFGVLGWEVTTIFLIDEYPDDASLEYVRKHYGVPARVGGKVRAGKKLGVIVCGTNYVFVRLNGEKHALPYHPEDLEYLEDSQ